MTGPRNSLLARLSLRLSGQLSADPRDIEARLTSALKSAAEASDDRGPTRAPRSAQVICEVHTDPKTYGRWRDRQLRKLPGAFVPELKEERWALVLWAMRPSAVSDFTRRGKTGGLLDAPQVGQFPTTVGAELALAAVLAEWLGKQTEAVRLAPPLLRESDGRYRLAALGREWPLPTSDFLPALTTA